MAPVSSASRRPFVPGKLADAPMNAPVCSHTMTGAGFTGAGSETQTFNLRQSSRPEIVGAPNCDKAGQFVGGTVASNTDGAQGTAGCGGRQRLLPAGDAAYGMPRKAQDDP